MKKKNSSQSEDLERTELIGLSRELNPLIDQMRTKRRAKIMERKEFFVQDGFPMFYREWSLPKGNLPTKIIVCLHGLHSHGEKFVLLADKFIKFNWITVAPDLRGHGLSWEKPEDLGDITDYTLWIQDLQEFYLMLTEKYPNIPIHIIAESMGAAAAIHSIYLLPPNIRSIILLSPALKPWPLTEFTMIQQLLSHAVVNWSDSKKSILATRGGRFSSNSDNYIQYQRTDPFRLRIVTPRYRYQVLKMIHPLRKMDYFSFLPCCIFYGEKDHIIDFDAIKSFIFFNQTKDKALHYIPEAYHELLTDTEAVNYGLYKKITQWLHLH